MDAIQIRPVSAGDMELLQEIGRKTFVETFAEVNSEENMKAYLEGSFSREKLMNDLNDRNAEFYFAIKNNAVIGYLKVNSGLSQTEIKDDSALEIERIYVLKEFHGANVGHLLFKKAMHIARKKNASYIWLGVWEENKRAIGFYRKNGFTEFDRHLFKLGDDLQTDIMMKLDLSDQAS